MLRGSDNDCFGMQHRLGDSPASFVDAAADAQKGNRLLADGLLEMTIPDKPTSSKQRYRTTDKGRNLLASLKEGGA
jgi:ATP-dependent DNA helicase RecG